MVAQRRELGLRDVWAGGWDEQQVESWPPVWGGGDSSEPFPGRLEVYIEVRGLLD